MSDDDREKAWTEYRERTFRYVEKADFYAGWDARPSAAPVAPDLRPVAQRLAEATGISYADATAMLAPVAPDREALAKALYANRVGPLSADRKPLDNLPGHIRTLWFAEADALLATPGLFQSRAEVEAKALDDASWAWITETRNPAQVRDMMRSRAAGLRLTGQAQ